MKFQLFICLLAFGLQATAQRTVRQEQMKLGLSGLFISGHRLTFDLLLFNHSPLGYLPQYFKFYIRERHLASRTALQDREIRPLSQPCPAEILPDSSRHIFLDFYQFSIPRTQELVIEVKEKNGYRNLALHIPGHRLLKMIHIKMGGNPSTCIHQKNQVYE